MKISRQELEIMWENFLQLPFPEGVAGEQVNGVDLTQLDTYCAGCISSYVAAGKLSSKQIEILESSLAELQLVLPDLASFGVYFKDLEKLIQCTLAADANDK